MPSSYSTTSHGLACPPAIDLVPGVPETATTVSVIVVIIILIRSFTNLVAVIRD